MGKKANPTMVGAFVLGSLAIVIAVIIGLGSSHLFRREHKFVMFFSSDVNGLNIGAPVKFRGVEIGSVTNILLSLGGLGGSGIQQTGQIRIPVIIQLDSRKLFARGAELDLDDPQQIAAAIQLGLRGQLKTESMLTGLAYIDLDMHPDTPVKYYLGRNSPYPEIPTVPTPFEQAQTAIIKIVSALGKVDFDALTTRLTQTATSINDLVKSQQVRETIASLNQAAIALNGTAQSIKKTSDDLSRQVEPAAEDLRKTTASARAALKEAQDTLVAVQSTLGPGSPVDYQLTQTLEQTGDAARSLRQLADYLQRNPSSVIRGRYAGDSGQ
jgi:phospholipid/cholesterol/gamma-HCH transport system substrate-binding protein